MKSTRQSQEVIVNLTFALGPSWPTVTWKQGFGTATWVLRISWVLHYPSARWPITLLSSLLLPNSLKIMLKQIGIFFPHQGQSILSPCTDAAKSSIIFHSTSVYFSTCSWSSWSSTSPYVTQRFGCAKVQGLVCCSIAVWFYPSFTKKIVKLWQSVWTKARRDKKLKWQECCCWDDSS